MDGNRDMLVNENRTALASLPSSASGVRRSSLPRIPAPTAYQRFCHRFVLPIGDHVFGQNITSRLTAIADYQWKSADEIRIDQSHRLRNLIRIAFCEVPWYRDVRLTSDLSPDKFHSPDDLQLLPVMTKATIREHFEQLQRDDFVGPTQTMSSSGSTGTPLKVRVDNRCLSEIYATQLLFWSWGGFAMGKPHLQTGMSLNRGVAKRLKDILFRCHYVSAMDLTDAHLQQIADRITTRRLRSLFGYASSLYVIAKYFDRQGMSWNMDHVFSWGDMMFPEYRSLIERVFSCRVSDCYGLGEGIECAAQCERHEALHEAMHAVILEIVDGNGRPCPPGKLGRLLVTRLEPGPMPLIRYDTGDAAYFIDEPCGCGRSLRLISPIQGRNTDIITTSAGDRLIVHFFTKIFEPINEIKQFQIRQEVPGEINVLYVPHRDFSPSILLEIEHAIQSHCRSPLRIQFTEQDDIPLERSNKRRFVISSVDFN